MNVFTVSERAWHTDQASVMAVVESLSQGADGEQIILDANNILNHHKADRYDGAFKLIKLEEWLHPFTDRYRLNQQVHSRDLLAMGAYSNVVLDTASYPLEAFHSIQTELRYAWAGASNWPKNLVVIVRESDTSAASKLFMETFTILPTGMTVKEMKNVAKRFARNALWARIFGLKAERARRVLGRLSVFIDRGTDIISK